MPIMLTIATLCCVGALIGAEAWGRAWARGLAKTLASLGFLGVGLALNDAGAGLPGVLILVGLALSVIGDVCLLSQRRGLFLGGMGAFAFAHIAYAVSFLVRGAPEPLAGGLAAIAMAGVAVAVLRWLRGRLGALAVPVSVYIILIGTMVVTAIGAGAGGHAPPQLALAAILFAISDIAVARDRFVADRLANKLWGLPLYYGAQLIFAWYVAH